MKHTFSFNFPLAGVEWYRWVTDHAPNDRRRSICAPWDTYADVGSRASQATHASILQIVGDHHMTWFFPPLNYHHTTSNELQPTIKHTVVQLPGDPVSLLLYSHIYYSPATLLLRDHSLDEDDAERRRLDGRAVLSRQTTTDRFCR